MLGRKESLNVATAAGVVLYELLRQHRASPAPASR
jgi:tRNA G18 (ribose-2'-O)-methylase SpoU